MRQEPTDRTIKKTEAPGDCPGEPCFKAHRDTLSTTGQSISMWTNFPNKREEGLTVEITQKKIIYLSEARPQDCSLLLMMTKAHRPTWIG
jgi:hypothetical protein